MKASGLQAHRCLGQEIMSRDKQETIEDPEGSLGETPWKIKTFKNSYIYGETKKATLRLWKAACSEKA